MAHIVKMSSMNIPNTLPSTTLGSRLSKARKINGWNQTQMAAKLCAGRRSISRYEDDWQVPSHAIIIAWASLCDVPLDWLEATEDASLSAPHIGEHIDQMIRNLGRFNAAA